MVPVKNSDLWQRLDRTLRFHDVECQRRRFDRPLQPQECVNKPHRKSRLIGGIRKKLADWVKYATKLRTFFTSNPEPVACSGLQPLVK
jgi:hypothetical protein